MMASGNRGGLIVGMYGALLMQRRDFFKIDVLVLAAFACWAAPDSHPRPDSIWKSWYFVQLEVDVKRYFCERTWRTYARV